MVAATRSNTQTRLLAAAEKILVEKGLTGLSVRKVGEQAGVNATLVTYHFKSISNLLEELCQINLDPILARWSQIGGAGNASQDFDDILEIWLEALLLPSAITAEGRALVVLDEIIAHGEGSLRQSVLEPMEQFSERLRSALAPFCPHLHQDELRARVRFISGAALGPPPRGDGSPLAGVGNPLDDLDCLLNFARAALRG
ncbi:hypothetical protein GCM10009127_09230 [Alteraurantiacibacter aestuarii]|uniref:TetR family transcriptional regulator n=1 Tax=Alteraurantiacibacter aestuarii TaxID=650004 RepID=A0A844ZFK6_9SPHN|nr:TetR/AcrR family transcriptional regulator [Alteraurantiacibacter aestuarii]MXO87311.1 TetR family transcriptional regulator [Alteraurantiacibacter aestuarii]